MKNRIYVIFPYLIVDNKFSIEGVEFKGLFEIGEKSVNNISLENKDDQYHLSNLLKSFSFFEKGTYGFTYITEYVNGPEQYAYFKDKLSTALNIIRYKLFDKDERGHISFSQTSFYVFELTEQELGARGRKLRSKDEEFVWYRGYRDFEEEINLHWPRTKIYPPRTHTSPAHLYIPDNYFLCRLEKNNWRSDDYSSEERTKLLRAIELYNKSYSEGYGVDERDRVLSLCAGFEALFSLPEQDIQKSFKSSILTLLGDVSALSEWADNFYNLRSKIVHGVEICTTPRKGVSKTKTKSIPSLFYKHPEGDEEYIRNLSIGQAIFQKSLEIILDQRATSYVGDIQNMLEPNEVHLKRIKDGIKSLTDKESIKEWYETKVSKAYNSLRINNGPVKFKELMEAGALILNMLNKLLLNKKINLTKEIDDVLNFKGDAVDLAMVYHELDTKYSKIFMGSTLNSVSVEELVLGSAAHTFISFASHTMFYFKGEIIK